MEGGGRCQLWPKRGKLLAGAKITDIVYRQILHAPKQRSRFPFIGIGLRGGPKGNLVIPARRLQHTAAGTAIRQEGRSCDGAGGQWAGRHDKPLHAEETVHRGGVLDMAYEARRNTGDGDGRLYS